MKQTVVVLLLLGSIISACGPEYDGRPEYGNGKFYDQKTNLDILVSSRWCYEDRDGDKQFNTYSFNRNGTGEMAVWNGQLKRFMFRGEIHWALTGLDLKVTPPKEISTLQWVENIRFQSQNERTVLVMKSASREGIIRMHQCSLEENTEE